MTEAPEEWRPIVDWEGLYEVSSLGRVRSLDRVVHNMTGNDRTWKRRHLHGRILTPVLRGDGYLKVCLKAEGECQQMAIHRLVCEAFHGTPSPGDDAAHFDGVKTNNRRENLRWASRAENMADKVRHDTHQRGERAFGAKLDEDAVRSIRAHRSRSSDSYKTIGAKYGVSASTVHLICKGKNWGWLP